MGRRYLPKIQSDVNVGQHLLQLSQLTPPLDFEALISVEGELEVEVGTGKGLFLSQASQQWPTRRFLGIEISPRYARFAAARLASQQSLNARVIDGDGVRFFREFLETGSVRAVHVYFPDPWWKRRHRKRRVMHGAFLKDIERVLRPDGILYFRTDVEEYFRATLRLIEKETELEGPLPVVDHPEAATNDYRTHFERRMRLNDLPVYRAEFRRRPARDLERAASQDGEVTAS
jgi:tRNA (guanine-N7-)-methyltransferase